MPTILDLIEAEIPKNIDGESFANLLKTNEDIGRDSFLQKWHGMTNIDQWEA